MKSFRPYILLFGLAILLAWTAAATEFRFDANSNIGGVALGMSLNEVWDVTGGPERDLSPDELVDRWEFTPARKGLSEIRFVDKKVVRLTGYRLNAIFPKSNALSSFDALERGMTYEQLLELGLASATVKTGHPKDGILQWEFGPHRLLVSMKTGLVESIILESLL